VLVEAKSVLSFVCSRSVVDSHKMIVEHTKDGLWSTSMSLAVVGPAKLVGSLLAMRLGAVGLSATVIAQSISLSVHERLRAAYRANLSVVSVNVSLTFCCVDFVESGVIPSPSLVWRSLRPMSDILAFGWGFGVVLVW